MPQTTLQPCPFSQRGSSNVVKAKVSLTATSFGSHTVLTLHYVPDRDVVPEEQLVTWMREILQRPHPSAAECVAALSMAFYDIALPSYVDVRLEYHPTESGACVVSSVRHQPDYTLPRLLERFL